MIFQRHQPERGDDKQPQPARGDPSRRGRLHSRGDQSLRQRDQQLGHNLNANVTAPGESSRQWIRLDPSGHACEMHDAWPTLVEVGMTPHISVYAKGDAKTSQMAWVLDIRASGGGLALRLLKIVALGLRILPWEVLSVVAKPGFRPPSLVGKKESRAQAHMQTITLEIMQLIKLRIVPIISMSVLLWHPLSGNGAELGALADDQVGCLITGNAADLPGCHPPPGMELN